MTSLKLVPICYGCDEETDKPLKQWGDFQLCESCFKDTERAYQEDMEQLFGNIFKQFDIYGSKKPY